MESAYTFIGALSLIAVPAWPLMRVCASRPFWRTFPRIAATAAGVLVAYILAGIGIILLLPLLLIPFLMMAVGAAIYMAWRTRPGYGRARGWPAGSLTLLSPAPWFNEQFFQQQAERHGPIFKTSHFLRPMVCVVSLPIGLDLLRRHDSELGTPPLPFSRFIPGGYLRYLDPEVHEDYKAIFRDVFSPEVVNACRHFMVDDCREGLRAMADASALEPKQGIRPKAYLNRMLFSTWVRLFLGITANSKDFEPLRVCYQTIDMRNRKGASDKTIERALEKITTIMLDQIDRIGESEQTGQQVPRCFLAELSHSHPEALNDPTVMRNLIYFLHVTWSDVAALLLWLLKMLSDHPDWVTKLRQALAAPGSSVSTANDLSVRVVSETLRLEQSEHLYRRALGDIHFGGFVVPKGWMVRICIRESHQNEAVFSSPECFDPDRFLESSYKISQYCPFGAFRLACLGQFLTRTLGEIFVREIAAGYQWHVTDDGPRVFGSWRHWRPNPKFSVCFASRT